MSQLMAYPTHQRMLPEVLLPVSTALPALARTQNDICVFPTTLEAGPTDSSKMADSALDAFSSAYARVFVVEWGQRFEARATQLSERFRRLTEHLGGATNVVWFYRT